jgi:gamma-glutamyl-gamma-aminobutyrate hydrolase PuuD
MKKVYIEYGNPQYRALFEQFGFSVVFSPEASDLVVFTGGSDVSPALYGDKQHPTTGNDPHRDMREKALFDFCVKNNLPMVGICRGGQFLNVMNGGRMYQDVTGHTMSHDLVDLITGEVVYVSSTHHQMMLPGDDSSLVAVSQNVDSYREWYEGTIFKRDQTEKGIEVVYYEKTNSLCFQPHPEFSGMPAMRKYFDSLLARYTFAYVDSAAYV